MDDGGRERSLRGRVDGSYYAVELSGRRCVPGAGREGASKMQHLKMQDLKMKDQISGHENAGPKNAGPSRNAASLYCVCMAKWTVTSSKGIGVILSWFFINTLL